MSTLHRFTAASAETRLQAAWPRLRGFGSYLAAWARACVAAYRAAALYERLKGLSNADLNRRGLSRSTLAWDIAQFVDRHDGAHRC
jgi:hypothetical protein